MENSEKLWHNCFVLLLLSNSKQKHTNPETNPFTGEDATVKVKLIKEFKIEKYSKYNVKSEC